MAQRRMISLSVIDTDKFIDLPASTRLLYYDLSMRADDDGFVSSPNKIARMVGCSIEDLDKLIENEYLIRFESGVVAIKHWKISNRLKKDRYTPTRYKEELGMLVEVESVYCIRNRNKTEPKCSDNGTECVQNRNKTEPKCSDNGTKCVPNRNKTEPQDSIGKDRLVQDSSDKDSSEHGGCEQPRNKSSLNYEKAVDSFNRMCPSLPKVRALTDNRRRLIDKADKLINGDFEALFRKAEASDYLTGKINNWRADLDWILKDDNPLKILEGKYDNRVNHGKQRKSSFEIEELEKLPLP